MDNGADIQGAVPILDVLDKARSIVALWPEADAGSLVAGHGSVIVSGLFAWAGDGPDPARELLVQGQRLSLEAIGRAVGLVPATSSCLPMVAFHMRRIDDATPSVMQFLPASPRTLGALSPHLQPCDGGDSRAPCGNMSLQSLLGSGDSPSRCWLHRDGGDSAVPPPANLK